MKAFILLCDAGTVHPDGTFSLLRGGIDRVYSPKNRPIKFQGSFVARIRGSLADAGKHEFVVKVLNEDGQAVAPDLNGEFEVQEGGGAGLVVVGIALIFPSYGRYTFSLLVDKHELDTWEIHAAEAPPPLSRKPEDAR